MHVAGSHGRLVLLVDVERLLTMNQVGRLLHRPEKAETLSLRKRSAEPETQGKQQEKDAWNGDCHGPGWVLSLRPLTEPRNSNITRDYRLINF